MRVRYERVKLFPSIRMSRKTLIVRETDRPAGGSW
jgi:hypothetical protein